LHRSGCDFVGAPSSRFLGDVRLCSINWLCYASLQENVICPAGRSTEVQAGRSTA